MTHDKLLAKIEAAIDVEYFKESWLALRAVVELHKVLDDDCDCEREHIPICNECIEDYRCPTIQAIEKELQ